MTFPVGTRATAELITPTIWNADLVANMNALGPHLIVRKTSDQSVTSSTVLVNDTALLMAVAANEVWRFEMMLFWAAAATADLKWTFTAPAGATYNASTVYPFAAGGGNASIQQVIAAAVDFDLEVQDAANNLTMFYGLIVNGGTAGNLQFQFAQNASSATPTTVKTHSTLWAVKLV